MGGVLGGRDGGALRPRGGNAGAKDDGAANAPYGLKRLHAKAYKSLCERREYPRCANPPTTQVVGNSPAREKEGLAFRSL